MKTPQADAEPYIKQLLDVFAGDADAASAALQHYANNSARQKARPNIPTGPILVEIEQLSKRYKVGKQHIDAVRDVSLQIHESEFVAFTGPSGSGKSTLLQLIGGLDKPSGGRITVDGHDLTKLSDRRLSVFRNRTIGFVFQFFYLQPFLRLETNLEVPGMFARTKRSERHERATELAKAVGLENRLRHLPKELSGGQMQRAAIARAMLNKPKLMLADEPTGNLDSVNGRAIIELFEQMRKDFGTTIIIVTHDPKVAAHADREIKLEDGVIAA
jgi:ABC-type lipoprotein export system ATPase subunit